MGPGRLDLQDAQFPGHPGVQGTVPGCMVLAHQPPEPPSAVRAACYPIPQMKKRRLWAAQGLAQVGAGDGTFTQMPGPQKCGREGGRRGRGQVGGSRRHEEGELQTEMPFEGSLERPPPRGQVPRVEQHTLHQLGTHCAHGRGARPTRGREGRTPHLAQGPQFSQQTGATVSH